MQAGRLVGQAAGVALRVTAAALPPLHPGRCAALRVGDWVVGHAGELHPKVVEALGLPPRTCAMELDLDALPLRTPGRPRRCRRTRRSSVDVALVAPAEVPAAELADALLDGGGDLLEDVRLFDVYTGEQVGAGHRSLAFTLRFRAPDRTLTSEEANAARDAAVAVAPQRRRGAARLIDRSPIVGHRRPISPGAGTAESGRCGHSCPPLDPAVSARPRAVPRSDAAVRRTGVDPGIRGRPRVLPARPAHSVRTGPREGRTL